MRLLRWTATAPLLPAISLLLAPTLLTAQAVKPQPHVIAPDEGDVGVQPNGIRHQSKVGSLSAGASQLFVGTATIPPGAEIATHLHEIDEEVLYVVSGEITVTLGGNEYTVAQGGMVFTPPGTWMAIANRTESPTVILGVLSRGELEECFRAMYSTDADERARHHALSLCRARSP